MKAIMYHYVREHDEETPNFIYLDVKNFEKQVEYLCQNYHVLNKEEIIDSINNSRIVDKGIILTFDDGLKDHYQYVYPILKKYGVAGIFYVPTQPYFHKQLLDVHRVHYLLGRFGGKYIYEQAMRVIEPQDILSDKISVFENSTYQKQNNDSETVLVKQLFNYIIHPDKKTRILTQLMAICGINEEALAYDFYMTDDQMLEMENNGMIIGSHSHSHTLLSNLSDVDQSVEITESISYLSNVLQKRLTTFCYPYGGKLSYNQLTLDILAKEEIGYAFTVESRDIDKSDLENQYLIPRYDCNEFPYGKASGIK